MAAVAFDAVGAGANTAAANAVSISQAHTAAGGVNCAVLAFVDIQTGTGSTSGWSVGPSCTYGGTAMTLVNAWASVSTTEQILVYGLMNPPTGSQTVSFTGTLSSSVTAGANLISVSYINVGDFSCSTDSAMGNTTNCTITAPATTVNQMIVAMHTGRDVLSAPTRTQRYLSNTNGHTLVQDVSGTGSSIALACTQASTAECFAVAVILSSTTDVYCSTASAGVRNASSTGVSFAFAPDYSGANTLLVVALEESIATGGTATSTVTYGGTQLTKWGDNTDATNGSYTALFYMFNPGTSSQTVAVTTSGTATVYANVAAAMVYQNVNATCPAATITSSGTASISTTAMNVPPTGMAVASIASSVFLGTSVTPYVNEMFGMCRYYGGSVVTGTGDYALLFDLRGQGASTKWVGTSGTTWQATHGFLTKTVPKNTNINIAPMYRASLC